MRAVVSRGLPAAVDYSYKINKKYDTRSIQYTKRTYIACTKKKVIAQPRETVAIKLKEPFKKLS